MANASSRNGYLDPDKGRTSLKNMSSDGYQNGEKRPDAKMSALIERFNGLQKSFDKVDEIATVLRTFQNQVAVLCSEIQSLKSEMNSLVVSSESSQADSGMCNGDMMTEVAQAKEEKSSGFLSPGTESNYDSLLSEYHSAEDLLIPDEDKTSETLQGFLHEKLPTIPNGAEAAIVTGAMEATADLNFSLKLKRKRTRPEDDNRTREISKKQNTTEKGNNRSEPRVETMETVQNEVDRDERVMSPIPGRPTERRQNDNQLETKVPTNPSRSDAMNDQSQAAAIITRDVDMLEEQPMKSHVQPVQPIRLTEAQGNTNDQSLKLSMSDEERKLDTCTKVDDRIDAPEVRILEDSELEDLTLKEANRASDCRDPKSQGADTILCIDTSESMSGDPITRVKALIDEFLDGIDDNTINHSLEENVALVTFGKQTRVQQNLTNDYTSIREIVDTLETGGPSPMMTGLVLCLSAIYNRGGVVTYRERRIQPRIILFTDGKATDQRIFDGPDAIVKQGLTQSEIWQKLMEFGERFRTHAEPRKLICVPVGDANKTLLQQLCNTAGGNIFNGDSMKRLSQNFLMNTVAAELIHNGILDPGMPSTDVLEKKIKEVKSTAQFDKTEIGDVVDMIKQEWEIMVVRSSAASNSESVGSENLEMPPVGTRVRRGPDWKWNDADGNMAGTVVSHKSRGWLTVEWDNGNKDKYRYGAERGAKDVRVVEEPRILPPSELAAVGVRAKRGKDWEWGNQDGGEGSTGIVFKIEDSGVIHVRWDNGKRGNYRFGLFGKFDIEICKSDGNKGTDQGTGDKGLATGGAKIVKWQWQDEGGDWKDYNSLSSDKIENLYQKRGGKGTVIVENNGENFRVVPEKQHQRGISSGKENPIRRVEE